MRWSALRRPVRRHHEAIFWLVEPTPSRRPAQRRGAGSGTRSRRAGSGASDHLAPIVTVLDGPDRANSAAGRGASGMCAVESEHHIVNPCSVDIVPLAQAEIVPQWPGAAIGHCPGMLFVGTNSDIVRAAVWATGPCARGGLAVRSPGSSRPARCSAQRIARVP